MEIIIKGPSKSGKSAMASVLKTLLHDEIGIETVTISDPDRPARGLYEQFAIVDAVKPEISISTVTT